MNTDLNHLLKKKDIICIGGASTDFKFKSVNPLLLKTSNSVSSRSSFGGVARNVAHNLAKVTENIHLQCVVGNDANGGALLSHMQSLGVNTQYSQILNGKRTSQYHAILNEDGELFIGLADMSIYDELRSEFITASWDSWNENCLLFVDTNLPAALIELILKKASSANMMVCIDPVSVEKAQKIPYRLDSVFLIKPDMQEASTLTGVQIHSMNDCMRAGLKLRERGAQNVVISLGKLGYVLINDTHEIHVKAEDVPNAVDVSGAGDAFIAGILYGLQYNKDVLDACKIGAQSASLTIQSTDTVI